MPEPDAPENENAIAAGWNPDDGPAPNKHGKYVAPLAESENLDDLLNPDGTIK